MNTPMPMLHDKRPSRCEPLALVEFDRSGATVDISAVWWTSPIPTFQLGRKAYSGSTVTIRIPPRFRQQFLEAVQRWVALCDSALEAPEAPRAGRPPADLANALPARTSQDGGR